MDPLSILLAGSKEEEEETVQVQTAAFIPAKVEKNLYDDQDSVSAKRTTRTRSLSFFLFLFFSFSFLFFSFIPIVEK
jgi:hypothetical protein